MNLASLLQENPNLHAISECFAIAGPDRAAYSEEAQSRLHLLPAADNALVGIALGMAMDGSSVVVELASAQSLWSIIAQLGEENHKAFARPIAIRVPITPMDTIPWSALESLDCDVWCPRSQEQRHNIIQQSLTAQRPTIVLEPQTIRKQKSGPELSASERITEGEDISLFAWGDSVSTARLIAAQMQDEDIFVEVIALNQLSPLQCDLIVQSTQKTGRPIFIEPPSQLLHKIVSSAFWRLESQPTSCRHTETEIRNAIIEALS